MKKKLLAILLTVCMVLSMAPASLAADSVFTDVKADDWFADEVKYVYDNGLMNGVGDNTFDPSGSVTRAMVWTTLARLDGVDTTGSDPWWLTGQKWAMENGISDGTMAENNVTREQLVTMIWRYAKYIDMDVSEGEDTNILSYTDAFDVNEWAISAMQWACAVGIINGIDGALQPQGDATRAQLAAILYRFVEEVVNAAPATHTVTFMWNYGNMGVYDTVEVEDGKSVGTLRNPSRNGYTFSGWYTEDGDRFTLSTKVTADIIVFAKWNEYVYIPVHTHSWTAGTPVAPTCTEQGYTPYTCVCGSSKNDDFVDALNHAWGDWISNDDGTHTRTCGNASAHTETENCSFAEASDICICGYDRTAKAKIGDTYYSTVPSALAAAVAGDSIILLADVDTISFTNATAEDLTIMGREGVTVGEVELIKTENYGAPDGLTLQNITFNGRGIFASGTGNQVKDLSVIGCKFTEGAMLGMNAEVSVDGLTVQGCNFAATSGASDFYKTQIILQGDCKNIVISGNTMADAEYNAIQLSRTISGDVTISGNTINGTGDRALRFGTLSGAATVTISGNTITDGADDDGQVMKFTTAPADDKITLTGNTWNGYDDEDLGYTDGIWTLPVEIADGFVLFHGTTYEISNVNGLKYFRDAVNNGTNNFSGKTVKLTADIDLNNEEWTPIGADTTNYFKGTFDGQNKIISNLKIDSDDESYIGLFGYIKGGSIAVKNIKIHNVDIHGYQQVGAIVGYAYLGTITNCHVSGNIKIIAEYAYAGGITSSGYFHISDCSVIADADTMGEITAVESACAGGIIARHEEGNFVISNCEAKNLKITAWANAGAITGFVHYGNTIEHCSAENIVLTKTRDGGAPSIGMAAGGWSYNASNAITIQNNSFKNITLNGNAKEYGVDGKELFGSEYYGAITTNFVLSNNTTENITNNMTLYVAP